MFLTQKRTAKMLLAFLASCCAYQSSATLSGTYTINPGGTASSTNYLTLTSALSDLTAGTRADGGTANGAGVSGPVILELDAAYTSTGETFPLTLGAVTGASTTNNITIRPASATSSALSITTSNSGNTVLIDGGSYYMIDGRPGGTGTNKYLTIDNTNGTHTDATLRIANDATRNIIKYCIVQGSNTTAAGGVVEIGTTTGTIGNDKDTIDNCDITKSAAANPANTIYALGTSAKRNDSCVISNCNISNFKGGPSYGIYIGDYNAGWAISGNSIFQSSAITGANAIIGIGLIASSDNLSNFYIKGNYIGGNSTLGGSGTWSMSSTTVTNTFRGIQITAGASGTSNNIQGNTISKFALSTNTAAAIPGAWCGIYLVSGSSINVGDISPNIIGATTGTGAITVNNRAGVNIAVTGITNDAAGTINISNNKIGSITTIISGPSSIASIHGIVATTANNITVNGNIIGSTTTANSFNATLPSTNTVLVTGINFTAVSTSSTITANNNIIGNLTNAATGTTAYTQGIKVAAGNATITGNTIMSLSSATGNTNAVDGSAAVGISIAATGTEVVSKNIIYNLKNTTGSAAVSVKGIYLTGTTSATNTADGNLIHSLSATSAAALINGIHVNGGTYTISNNMIRLGIDGSGTSLTTTSSTVGIRDEGAGANNIYHNSVYVGGTGINGAVATYAFYTTTNNTRSILNNIFVNNRSNGTGTGKHYAIALNNASNSNLTMSNNIYQATGTGGILGYFNSTDYATLSGWQTATGMDANAQLTDPLFITPAGTSSTVDLHLSHGTPAESAGATGTGITTDFDGETRSNFSPVDIGADANDFSAFTWSGATNSTWSTGTNWVGNNAPATTDSAVIPGGKTNYPNITTGTEGCTNIKIATGGIVTISGGTLQVSGNITNSGTINATGGTVELNGSAAQTIQAGTFTATGLILNNSAGATITSGMINILDTYTPTSGVLATGGFFTLKSTATGTARIAAGATAGGYITGNVTIERFVPGRRAYRFFAHPFSSSIALSQLTDDIDITGSGGATNGFTTSGSNNPSSFWYDVTAGDNSTTGNNPGWTAFTNTNGSGANAWPQYGAARILVRGALGEGLNGVSYTPSDVTLDMTGAVNQGNTTISLTKGSGTSFVLVGNPFPSQVDMDALSSSSVGSAFYIWDATAGTRGAYTSYSYGSSSFALPSCGSFVTTLSANGSITFNESAKTNLTSGTMFKTTAAANTVQLRMEDSTTFWDRLLLHFDNNAAATVDYPDAAKLYNPDISFYTFSRDDSMLSIDARPYTDGEVIRLGLYSTMQKSFKIRASDFDMPAGTKLYLNDKYLNKVEEITGAGYEYWFTVNADTASWGNKRFELNTKGTPTTTVIANATPQLKAKLVPNPATDNVTIYIDGIGKSNTTITVTDMMGVKMLSLNAGNKDSILLDTHSLASGIYMVIIHNNGQTITQKLIKQ